MPSEIHRIDPDHPDPVLIERAVRVMQAGGIIVFPTTGLYGLGVDATNRTAVDRVFALKSRADTKPILVLIQSTDQLDRWVTEIPPTAEKLINRYWPGGMTLVFSARPCLPARITAGTGKIGIRVPAHPVARGLVASADFPITATSANLAGQPGCATMNTIAPELAANTDLVLDAGRLQGGLGSTVIDVTIDPPEILRPGAVTVETIFFQSAHGYTVDKTR